MLILSFEPFLLWHWLFDISSRYFFYYRILDLDSVGINLMFDSNGFEWVPDEFDFGMSEYLNLVGMISNLSQTYFVFAQNHFAFGRNEFEYGMKHPKEVLV